jgi:hypothetical protein
MRKAPCGSIGEAMPPFNGCTEFGLPSDGEGFRSEAGDSQELRARRQEPGNNVRDRLATLLSASSHLARQNGCLVHTLGS